MIKRNLLRNGNAKSIYSIIENGNEYVKDFVDNECSESDKAKIAQNLLVISEHGPPRNREKFRSLSNNLFEIKPDKVRIICFFENNDINNHDLILTHGFMKKSTRTPKREIGRGLKIKKAYEESKKKERK